MRTSHFANIVTSAFDAVAKSYLPSYISLYSESLYQPVNIQPSPISLGVLNVVLASYVFFTSTGATASAVPTLYFIL